MNGRFSPSRLPIFFVDVLNNGRNLLVALLAVSLGLTNAQVGIALLLYNVGNALSQPLFGWLADRIGARLLVIGGLGWMILFYAIASLAGEWPARFIPRARWWPAAPASPTAAGSRRSFLWPGRLGCFWVRCWRDAPHILVIMVQSLLSKQQAMASGLALGFMFFSGAVGSYFVGLIADNIGLAAALQGLAMLPPIVIFIAIWLPSPAHNNSR